MSLSELGLLGHLIGDGCTLPRHAIQYTTNDESLAETVCQLADQVFGNRIAARIKRERDWFQVYLKATARLTHNVHNPVVSWLKELGIFGLRSYEKYVPERVFVQPEAHVKVFIRHLWSTDGCVNSNSTRGYPSIYYASSSERLALDVQRLLLRLGISARVARVAQGGKGRDQFHVMVRGRASLEKFLDEIGCLGSAKIRNREAIKDFFGSRALRTRDFIPQTIWDDLALPALEAVGISKAAVTAALGTRPHFERDLGREMAGRIGVLGSSEELSRLAESNVKWDRIVDIIPDGEADVYDLTVDDHHNFVAGNILSHNSLEQDSDLVLFIYRERFYNDNISEDKRNIAEIIIAKHRNGPTGKVELMFIDEQTKFANLERRRGA
jgi:replicative DNA helicase